MKKTTALIMFLVSVCILAGCQKDNIKPPNTVQMPNPIREATAEKIAEELGITFNLPKDAQDITYLIIDSNNGKSIAQAKFALDSIDYNYRIAPAESLSDISGAYYDWKADKEIEVGICSGEIHYIAGEQGICLWYDAAPGILYSLSMNKGASEEALVSMAKELYVPFQKDAG